MDSISFRTPSHVDSPNHHVADRFDDCRSDRMAVGSILRWVRNLAEAEALAGKAEEVLRKVDDALAAMDRVALVCIKAETAATLAGEFDKPARSLLDGGPDYEDALAWPDWTDESTWTTTEPTPLELLLPPVSGGSPDYQPTDADWAEFSRWVDEIHEGYELPEVDRYFSEADARAAGLAI
jgi:hypothetical protein